MADRSLSVNLRARVTSLVQGLRGAQQETTNLSRKMTETGASADRMRKRLEAATKALPKIEIDADSTAAEIKFAELRQRLEDLSSKKIGIDVDAADARAQLAEIERELSLLHGSEADINVKADIGDALTELRSIDREVSKLDGRQAEVKVDANIGGAVAQIAMVGAALAALPAVTTIGVGVVGLGAAFAAAGAGAAGFGAVAIPALGRVNEALKETESAAGGAGGAMKSAAQTAAEALSRSMALADAQDRVKEAAEGVKDAWSAYRQAQEDVGRTAEDVAARQEQAARRVEAAERSVQDAHRATQQAVEDLTRARERAQERMEDLILSVEGGALAEERAALSIRKAQAELARVNANPKASAMDKEDAALRLKEAEFALKRLKESNGDLAKEQEKANREGVEGSDEVKAAKGRIEQAIRREQDAERALGDARKAASQVAIDGARDIAEANKRVLESQERITDAQKASVRAQQQLKLLQLQQKAAMEQVGGGASGAASKLSELTKAEKALYRQMKDFKSEYLEWQKELQPDVLPVIGKGLELVAMTLPKISPLVRGTADAFSILLDDAKEALNGPFWTEFIYNLSTYGPEAIIGFGRSFGNIVTGIAGVIDAFLPFTTTVVGGIEDATKAFSEWGQNLEDNPQFQEFMAWVKENAPEVWEIIKNIAKALGNVAEAIAPLTLGAFGGLGLLAELVAGMDPGHIQNIALALGAIKLATMGMAAAKSWQNLAGGIDAVGGASGKARGKVEAFGKAAIGISAAVIGLQAVGSMVTTLDGSSKGIGELTLAMEELSQTGKWAGDLEDQWVGAFDSAGGAAAEFQQGLRDLADPGWVQKFISHPFTEIGAVLPGVDSAVDRLEQKFSDMDKTLGGMVQAGNLDGANRAFEELKKQAGLAGVPVSELEKLFPVYGQAVRVAGNATKEAADEVTKADDRLGDFQKSLDIFAGKTDALQAIENITGAYDDAKKAIADANGKLEINSRMTDQQRDAVIRAREKFGEYLSSVREGADAQKIMGKNVFDSTQQVLGQLPKMMDLAGKNQEAREQVLLLAQAYGISREDAIKAAKGGKDLRDVIAQLKSKTLHISADTSKADAAIGKIIRTLNKTYVIGVDVRSDRQEHGNRATSSANGNMFVGGKVMAFAGGSENHVAQIGRPGEIRIWNEPETAGESYIPHALSKRARSMDILRATAEKFGQQVVPLSSETLMSGASTTSFGASASSVLTVNLDNADAVVVSLDNTTRAMTSGLSQASSTLTSAMGSSGTLTTAVGELGSAASVLGDSLSDAVSDLAAEMRALTSAISSLRSAVSSAQSAAAPKTSSTSTSTSSKPSTSQAVAAASTIKKSAAALLNKSQAGYVGSTGGSSGPAQKSGASSLIKGSGPSSNAGVLVVPMANGGLVTSPTILAGEAGREMVVPLLPSKRARGVSTLSAAAGVMGLTVSPRFSSTPSAPRYMQGRSFGSGGGSGVDAEIVQLLRQIARKGRDFNIENYYEAQGGSARQAAEDLNFLDKRS